VLTSPTSAFSTNAKGSYGLLIGARGATQSSWAQVLDSKGLPLGAPVEFSAVGGSVQPFQENRAKPLSSLHILPPPQPGQQADW